MMPKCLTATAIENTVVLSFFVVVRESSPNIAAPAPAPIPVSFILASYVMVIIHIGLATTIMVRIR